MKVRATARGYHKVIREIGDEFDVPDDLSGSWFVPVEQVAEVVDEPAPVKRGPGRPPKI